MSGVSLANLGALPPATSLPLLHVAFSTSSLFESGWDGKGELKGWQRYQLDHQDKPMAPGPALAFCQGLLDLNRYSPDPRSKPLIHVHVVSRQNHAVSLRFLKSLEHQGLQEHFGVGLHQCSYLNGASPIKTLLTLGVHLFLSTNRKSVRQALKGKIAAAHLAPVAAAVKPVEPQKLVIGFDGDGLIFDDEAERVFQEQGLAAFMAHETRRARDPLGQGPLYGFLLAVSKIRSLFPETSEASPLNLILATARGFPAQERATRTLQCWDVRFDRVDFLSGREKGPVLEGTGATIFFDDGSSHIESVRRHGIVAGHVPWGIKNP